MKEADVKEEVKEEVKELMRQVEKLAIKIEQEKDTLEGEDLDTVDEAMFVFLTTSLSSLDNAYAELKRIL